MNSLFDTLNLRPAERRLIMGVIVVTFVVLNIWWVWPRLNDHKAIIAGMEESRGVLSRYESVATRLDAVRVELASKETSESSVLAASQGINFINTVQGMVAKTKINVTSWSPPTTSRASGTNDFFEEKTLPIQYVNTEDEQLLAFLISLGESDSMIRVRDLVIRTDNSRMKLLGRITLVASYQKESATKASTTP